MNLNKETVLTYSNFDKLSDDIISLAKEIMPDRLIYINFLNDDVQVTMKVSKNDTLVNINEGDIINVEDAICNNIDFTNIKPLILEDAKNNNFNEKVKRTIEKGNVGSYLGIPIVFKNGKRFGALCASHHEKKKFDKHDIELLVKIANLFTYYLELENHVYIDELTNLKNTKYLLLNQSELINDGGLIIMLDLDNFKLINDTLGHLKGDLILKEAGFKLNNFKSQLNKSYSIRLGGDEFIMFIKDDLSNNEINQLLLNLIKSFRTWNTDIENLSLTASIGALKFSKKQSDDYTFLYNKVDSLLYESKRNNKNKYTYKDITKELN